jgi:hypothetical protein
VIADDRVIPVVVAKCGLYLKEHGTEVEGAFRISGSSKRMRELQTLFDTGPKVCPSTCSSRGSQGLTTSLERTSIGVI